MRRSPLFALLALVPVACATPREKADAAFARADYVAAADQYDTILWTTPGDAAVRARRDDARARALVKLAAHVHQLRTARQPEQALTALAELLTHGHAWAEAQTAEARRAIADEVEAATAALRDELHGLVVHDQPLAAEQQLAIRHDALPFAELEALWPALTTEITERGQLRCRTAAPADPERSPYLARLAAAYCGHFGVDVPVAPHLPDQVSGLAIAGAISGMTEAQRARFEQALDEAIRQTPWYSDEQLTARARVQVVGVMSTSFTSSPAQRVVPWTEQIPYTASEAYQESYQEPYQESYQEPYQEAYTAQEPYTTYGSESYACGTSTCSRSTSQTSYRSVTNYRTAYRTAYRTSYRTAYRTAYRTVTRMRAEPREFSYRVTARHAYYDGRWDLAIEIGGGLPRLDVHLEQADHQSGDDHDASFGPANVRPSRAQLASADDWCARLIAALRPHLIERLMHHWTTAYCDWPTLVPEAAAHCVYGAPASAGARDALGRVFGPEVDAIVARFGRRTAAP